ncbi:MAG: hypothetical protein QOF20_3396 [Acidimicrobiaceae bacterium]|jgi:hypothetical protein|nr:hypothetical protein [Acidimicrobiaceae bacterium]MDQ1371043.1 hypothetical protein [Acidimicrobiaceae bacterium]MDQ1414432.1 hypothetical protein [Acidimicrobiaceae bacterium]MDQ1421351.1 hypothetical protein [Acidimicrobiaceae bacterium]MDQ1441278.1 hypothetical protein [Acidimicrobiaceae bacterium]
MALGSRPARTAHRRGRPWLFFAVAATLVVIAVNAALSARSPAPARQQAEQSYLDLALPAIAQSSQQGLDVNGVRAQALSLTPPIIANHINGILAQAQQTLTAVEKLNAPPSVKTAHALLIAAMDMRYAGTKALGQAIGTAMSGQPVDAGVQALAGVGLDYQAADRAYTLFQQAMPALSTPPPNSRWVTDAAAYTPATLAVFVASLRSEGSLAPVHAVSVVLLTTTPLPVNLQNGVQILPIAKQLSLQIVVADTGNQSERNLTVTATIAPSVIGPTQTVRDFVDLTPGQTRTVTLGGLRVLAGQPTTLTARIDAAPGETDLADNSKVVTLQMQ